MWSLQSWWQETTEIKWIAKKYRCEIGSFRSCNPWVFFFSKTRFSFWLNLCFAGLQPCRFFSFAPVSIHNSFFVFQLSSAEIKLSSRLRGICFCIVAAISATFLIVPMLIGHPFVLVFDRYRRKFHHLVAKIWASISIYPFYKIDIEGLENLPSSDTPAVYVSNHQSFLDIYTLLSLGKSFKFISKTGIFVIPVIGWAMSMMGVVPLKRMDPRSQVVLCNSLFFPHYFESFYINSLLHFIGLLKTLHGAREEGSICLLLPGRNTE